MLLNLNMNDYKKNNQQNSQQIKDDKKKRTACSQQALANTLVASSMASNPNAGQIQQAPVKQ